MVSPKVLNTLRFLLLAALFGAASTASAQTVHKVWEPPFEQGIAAIVEDHVITLQEMRREMAPLVSQVRQESRSMQEFDRKMSQLYLEVLDNLIDRVLILKEFQKKEFNIPSSVLEKQFDEILIEDFAGDRARLLESLEAQGKTMREFRKDLRERIIVSAMRGQMQRSTSAVSPERIQSYYDEHQLQFFEEASVHLRLILLRPLADEPAAVLEQTAQRIMGELDAGRPFAELAERFSQDGRADRGGDWGWISKDDIRAELAEVAFALEPGQYSEPILVGDQVFILYVEDKKPEGLRPLSDVREQIENILASRLAREAQEEWIERLRKDAYIKYM